jgi:hypothetical protein
MKRQVMENCLMIKIEKAPETARSGAFMTDD